ncbi:histidine kinase [Gramella aestuarii]|uniref:Histidine kinase n=2 Tax=Christiangramia aestuarii TaxID=1028746 RepID=A0A7K1LSE7_9FLAO|nr:histidine kinase [Christiangramia aestuarii]
MIAQAENKNLYFANSTGLLEFNGENWNIYPVPNNTIVRSLKVVGNRIYTGAYMEAGYWTKNDYGELEYTSLVPKFEGIGDGEQFWDIEFLKELIIFRSFGGIYFYDPQKDSVTKMPNPFGQPTSGIFKLEDKLFFQLVGEGLFQIRNGEAQLVIPGEQLGDKAIMHLYQQEGKLSIISGKTEFFVWEDGALKQNLKPVNREIGYPNILDAIDLEDGSLVLGTVGKGVLVINPEGEVVNSFNQANVLLNNTVLDLFQDESGMIWAGLDYGISSIDLNSSFRSFRDNKGEIGSVYASFEKDGALYLGTNQGLYLREAGEVNFQLIEGTNGQVWFIDQVGDFVFCGHDKGTFRIEGGRAIKVMDRLGTWLVKEYSEDVFVQGHYFGISFFKSNGQDFEVLPMLENFPHSSKFIEIDENLDLWVSNEHKGVFRLEINDSLTGYTQIENYKFPGESGITSSIFRFNDSLYYSSRDKIYRFDRGTDQFTGNNKLNNLIAGLERVSGKMISLNGDRKLWGFAKDGIFSIQPSLLNEDYSLDFTFIDQDFRNIAVGYENISSLARENYLLGIANGYLKFNTGDNFASKRQVSLDEISIKPLEGSAKKVKLEESGDFKHEHNNISFRFSTPVHDKYVDALYSYRLIGLSSNWSEWSRSAEANFENLGFGDYTFEVKAKVGDTIMDSTSYSFKVGRPFYLSTLAILGYILAFLVILFLIHLMNKRHHKRKMAEHERALKMKNLEAEQEIIKLKNEKLEQDMANKNRELAVSTMSLIKKNEFLTSIKNKLKASEESSKVKSVIKTIDKDINEEDNWKFFKKAFSNADKDFFKKIKARHPELTSNDLKLCAYLRLNLSSKEIAPLLNISVKSVEIKRYRLRKKMDLDRETNLTDYILAL